MLELIQGDNTENTSDGQHKKGDTYVDPAKTESGCSYSTGAVCLGQSNGGIKLNLNEGLLQLNYNVFFTGGRTFKISWTLADGTSDSKTTSKYSKGSYTIDVLDLAGLDEDTAKKVRSITFAQSGANGGARIYDMYVRVPATSTPTGISVVSGSTAEKTQKAILNGRLVILKNGVRYNAQGQIIK